MAAAGQWWLADPVQPFRVHCAVAALALLGGALLLRRRVEALAAIAVALLLAGPAAKAFLPPGGLPFDALSIRATAARSGATEPATAQPRRLTVLSANVLYRNKTPDEMVQAIIAADADVILLTEVIPSWSAIHQL